MNFYVDKFYLILSIKTMPILSTMEKQKAEISVLCSLEYFKFIIMRIYSGFISNQMNSISTLMITYETEILIK